jgi:hypothetical protein
VVLVSGIAHDLMDAGGVEIAQKPADDVRMPQSGVAGKMVGHRGDADRHVGRVDANRSRVRNVAPAGLEEIPGRPRRARKGRLPTQRPLARRRTERSRQFIYVYRP